MNRKAFEILRGIHHRFRRGKRWLLLSVIAACLVLPRARADGIADIITLLKTITSTIQGAIGGALSGIQTLNSAINNFRQQVLWPVAEINQTKSFVNSTRTQYSSLMFQIEAIKNNSATLENPSQLESAFRSGQAGSIGQLQPVYANVYGSVPGPNNARPAQRNMVDMDDALAQGSLKTTVLSDQTTSQMLALADSIEQQSAVAAPGSGPMLATQAAVANLETQAYLAKVLAAELRQEAGKLAHQNALLKQSAAATRNLQNQAQQVLTHP
jgi:hypothetical protein